MQNEFLKKYSSQIGGVISFYDRVVLKGTLPSVCHDGAMAKLLYSKGLFLKDFKAFVSPLRQQLIDNTLQIAKQEGIAIDFIRKPRAVRKEELVAQKIATRGTHPGLVCILSAMETCYSYEFHYNQKTGRPRLRATGGKCLHYYFYFIDPVYGLGYLRLPTWCPFQLQFYFNGHNWLARQLDQAHIDYQLQDNAFTYISDLEQAQAIADSFQVQPLHRCIDQYAQRFCPVACKLNPTGYRWSIMQVEYATDLIFKEQASPGTIFDHIIAQIMHSVTPDDVARFLANRALHSRNQQPLETSYKQWHGEIRRIKHRLGDSSVKLYDKFDRVLRVEITTNNVHNFKHYRCVEHQDGTKTSKVAPVKKSIYSLKALAPILRGCNQRYLRYIAAFDAPVSGKKRLHKIAKSTKKGKRSFRGFNFFDPGDEKLLCAIAKGHFTIRGFGNKELKNELTGKSTSQISRILRRLREKKLIKKVKNSYRYYLTALGRQVIATAMKIKELFIAPNLSY